MVVAKTVQDGRLGCWSRGPIPSGQKKAAPFAGGGLRDQQMLIISQEQLQLEQQERQQQEQLQQELQQQELQQQ